MNDEIKIIIPHKLNIDMSKIVSDEQFKKDCEEVDKIYNSSSESKKLIDSWNNL
jgi:hypothetical protein